MLNIDDRANLSNPQFSWDTTSSGRLRNIAQAIDAFG